MVGKDKQGWALHVRSMNLSSVRTKPCIVIIRCVGVTGWHFKPERCGNTVSGGKDKQTRSSSPTYSSEKQYFRKDNTVLHPITFIPHYERSTCAHCAFVTNNKRLTRHPKKKKKVSKDSKTPMGTQEAETNRFYATFAVAFPLCIDLQAFCISEVVTH